MKFSKLSFQLIIDRQEKYSLITLHATILAIILAFYSAYNIYYWNTKNDLESDVISEATKINTFGSGTYFPINKYYNINSTKLWFDLYQRLNFLIKNELYPDSLKIPLIQRKSEIVEIFSVIAGTYPFKQVYEIKDNHLVRSQNEKEIFFKNIAEVEEWYKNISLLYNVMDSISKDKDKIIEIINSNPTPLDFVIAKLFNTLDATTNIIINTKVNLTKYRHFIIRTSIAQVISKIFIIFTFAVFVFSVIFPIFLKKKSICFLVIFPFSFYIIVFLCAIFFL